MATPANNTALTPELLAKARAVKLLLLDVDGVLSDGKIFFGNNGEEYKNFNTLDGHGIKMLKKSGVEVGIITGRESAIVARRASDLGITLLIQGREDKWLALQEILSQYPCELEHIAYAGDDYPDLQVMTQIGFAVAVNNAADIMFEYAHYRTQRNGGDGAVREVCDIIMHAQGNFDRALTPYIQPLG